jgi:hypothetical protein
MLEDELVVDELEQSPRVKRPATYVDKVLDIVSGRWSVSSLFD